MDIPRLKRKEAASLFHFSREVVVGMGEGAIEGQEAEGEEGREGRQFGQEAKRFY